MKKLGFLLFLVAIFMSVSIEGCSTRSTDVQAGIEAAVRSAEAVAIPEVSYFQEKKTVARWYSHWDIPDRETYVYLVSNGTIIGYYVCKGKPASTRSYLVPEEEYYSNGATLSTKDLDGTYGENNPGIRFFTASGVAVEWGGLGATYIYSDKPLTINVPLLSR